ncbi:Uncharacterised protein [Acinetobacter nosocomialis]|nr:Uncharacterised protein [Acinetobacter nosocomialis]
MLLELLKNRFEKNIHRHKEIDWTNVRAKLIESPDKLWTLQEMENTGGEPDVVAYNKQKDEYLFVDCSAETPQGRRSLCYDREAPEEIRKLGGALFADRRYGRVFIYHNGAQSYYAARGFRCCLRV